LASLANPTGLNTARTRISRCRYSTSSAGLATGGYTGTITAATEEWAGAGSPDNSYNHSFLTLYLFI
jgi:hypothetical protein